MALNKKQTFFIAAFIILIFSSVPGLKNLDPKDFLDKIAAVVVAIGYFSETKSKKRKISTRVANKKMNMD